jgi:hypothetical protein
MRRGLPPHPVFIVPSQRFQNIREGRGETPTRKNRYRLHLLHKRTAALTQELTESTREGGGGKGKNRYRLDLLHKRTATQGLTESTTIHNRELTLSMFFCGPFGCSLTPSTRRSSFGLEIYSDPRLFAAIKLRPEPVHPLFLFFGFLWYAQAMSPITKKWPSFKHASSYFKRSCLN